MYNRKRKRRRRRKAQAQGAGARRRRKAQGAGARRRRKAQAQAQAQGAGRRRRTQDAGAGAGHEEKVIRLDATRDCEEVLTLAKASAAAYRRRGGYDSDAQEDAFLFIVSTDFKIDVLDERTRSYIVKTTAGALLRRDQNARGARLKNPPSFVPILSHEELEELGFKGVFEDAIASSNEDDDEHEKERAALAQALEELRGLDRAILDRVLKRTPAPVIEKDLNVGVFDVLQAVKRLVRRAFEIKGDLNG